MMRKTILTLLTIFTTLNGQVSISDILNNSNQMSSLQQISVTIGGEFLVNGTFPASSTERIDQFITRMFNTSRATILSAMRDNNAIQTFFEKHENYALRNIKLLNKDGNERFIDLAKFRLTGEFDQNPYLKDGDIIIFPTFNPELDFISVEGAVNKPIEFQFVEGDNLQTALFFARGINNNAYNDIKTAVISRLSNNGHREELIKVKLDSEIRLQSGDRIFVQYSEMNNRKDRVLVLGEVQRPGYVSISRSNTTLPEVIERVGGFTENASLKFAELIREHDSFLSLRRNSIEEILSEKPIELEDKYIPDLINFEFLKMFRAADLEIRDTLYFKLDNNLKSMSGFGSLDFRNLGTENSYESKYIVKDKDLIIIPEKKNEVYLWGGVAEIGYYPFNKHYKIEDYISLAGGLTEIAYGEDEIYLIKGKSMNWINTNDNLQLNIEPGDLIYVKKDRPQEEFWFYLGRIGAIATIFGGLATIYLAFK